MYAPEIISIKDEWVNYIHQLQDNICTALEIADGTAKFIEDRWQREEGGGGKTRVIRKLLLGWVVQFQPTRWRSILSGTNTSPILRMLCVGLAIKSPSSTARSWATGSSAATTTSKQYSATTSYFRLRSRSLEQRRSPVSRTVRRSRAPRIPRSPRWEARRRCAGARA